MWSTALFLQPTSWRQSPYKHGVICHVTTKEVGRPSAADSDMQDAILLSRPCVRIQALPKASG